MGRQQTDAKRATLYATIMFYVLSCCSNDAFSFVMTSNWRQLKTGLLSKRANIHTVLFYNKRDDDILKSRIQKMRSELAELERQQPPNPNLSPEEFVDAILKGLLNPYDPRPEDGFRMLLRSSTQRWRAKILKSIGAPPSADTDIVVSALGEAISRPNNQFAILVGGDEEYYTSFQTDPVDYLDGKCWMECRLRGKKDNALLVVTGWELQKGSNGAWLVDGIDWQDFRNDYRPGIGREEWSRICG